MRSRDKPNVMRTVRTQKLSGDQNKTTSASTTEVQAETSALMILDRS